MTEAQWRTCTKTATLLRLIHSLAGKHRRRLMLFNCACCRRIWHLLGKNSQKFIEVAERCADNMPLPKGHTLQKTEKAAERERWHETPLSQDQDRQSWYHASWAATSIRKENNQTADGAAIAVARLAPKGKRVARKAEELSVQCNLLRDVFGNPFQPFILPLAALSWNHSTVVRLAQVAYHERILPAGTLDNTRLAILADALEEAGCTDEQILTHLRSGGEHYRGCFVVDALLGKS